ncbi:MAG: hypothetical protein EOP42_20775, partial [Sphingobacteriaceae bacterium]
YLLNLLLCIVQAFLFFNPAVWLMQREISKYREQSCDDLVLDQTQNQLAYAHALLLIEQYRSQSLNLTLASNGKKHTLLNRIQRITEMKTNETSPKSKLVVLLFALFTIGLTVAWNLPLKKAIKHFTNHHFKVIKQVQDTSRVRIMSDKIVINSIQQSSKKITFTGKRMIFDSFTDTTIKSENKFKIILEDSLGNKKEYNSVGDLPFDVKKQFTKQPEEVHQNFTNVTFSYKHPNATKYTYHSKIYDLNDLKQQAERIKLMEEEREHTLAYKTESKEKQKFVNSPEYTKRLAEVKKLLNSPEYKQHLEALRNKLNSSDYAQQIKKLAKQTDSLDYQKRIIELSKEADKLNKLFDDPKLKKQIDRLNKLLVDSAQKNWRNESYYQYKPGSKIIYIDPKKIN